MVEGEIETGAQYHFYMETQSVIVKPGEKGQFDVHASTQWTQNVQSIAAQALGISDNLINVQV